LGHTNCGGGISGFVVVTFATRPVRRVASGIALFAFEMLLSS
jgi:hypothetical protein